MKRSLPSSEEEFTLFLASMKKQPLDTFIKVLLTFSNRLTTPDLRFSCIDNIWTALKNYMNLDYSEDTWTFIKSELLKQLEQESNFKVCLHLCEVTKEVAEFVYKENSWPDFNTFLIRMCTSQVLLHQQIFVFLFGNLVIHLIDMVPDLTNFDVVTKFRNVLLSDCPLKLKMAAFKGIISVDSMEISVSDLIDTLRQGLEESDEKSLEILLSYACESELNNHPSPLSESFNDIVFSILEKFQNLTIIGLNYLVGYLEEKKNQRLVTMSGFVERLVGVILEAMVNFLGDITVEQWTALDVNETDETTGGQLEIFLDRICLTLRDKIFPLLYHHHIQKLSETQNWKSRHVGLIILSIMSEGCSGKFSDFFPEIRKNLAFRLVDDHPRVRWAAINAIGQLSTDLGSSFISDIHLEMVPKMILLMDDDNRRVQAHALSVIINIFENISLEHVPLHLTTLVPKIISYVSGPPLLQSQAVTALAAVANSAKTQFDVYYPEIIPVLKNMLYKESITSLIFNKVLECISCIVAAVSKEMAIKDAKEVIEFLINSEVSSYEFIGPAIIRISGCLVEQFSVYIPSIIELALKELLKSGENIKIFISIDEALEPKNVSINKNYQVEKAAVCSMLFNLVEAFPEGVFPFLNDILQALLPLTDLSYAEEIQQNAIMVLPMVLNAQKTGVKNNIHVEQLNCMFYQIFNKLCEREDINEEANVLKIKSLAKSIKIMGENCVPAEKINLLFTTLKRIWQYVVEEKDTSIYKALAKLLKAITKQHPSFFINSFQNIVPLLVGLLTKKGEENSTEDVFLQEINTGITINSMVLLMLDYVIDPMKFHSPISKDVSLVEQCHEILCSNWPITYQYLVPLCKAEILDLLCVLYENKLPKDVKLLITQKYVQVWLFIFKK